MRARSWSHWSHWACSPAPRRRTPRLYRIRVVASAPLPGGAPGRFGSGEAWLDVR